MTDPLPLLTLSSATVAGLGLASSAALKGWREWLDLKRHEMQMKSGPAVQSELAELKARIRTLEAIADGTDG